MRKGKGGAVTKISFLGRYQYQYDMIKDRCTSAVILVANFMFTLFSSKFLKSFFSFSKSKNYRGLSMIGLISFDLLNFSSIFQEIKENCPFLAINQVRMSKKLKRRVNTFFKKLTNQWKPRSTHKVLRYEKAHFSLLYWSMHLRAHFSS